jgi:hypothetical protein
VPYVSVADIKSALGITDTTDDTALLSAATRATASVDAYLGTIRGGYVGFAAASNARQSAGSNTRTYHGTGHDTLFIDDADSIASVTVDDTAIAATAYVAEPLNGKPKRWLTYISPTSSAWGLVSAIWTTGTANVSVTGYWGLAAVPEDVVEVTLALAILYWRRMQLGGTPEGGYGPTGTIVAGAFIHDTEARAILSALDAGWSVPTILGA